MTAECPDRGDLRRELHALLLDAVPDLPSTVTDDTPLISSGLVESTTLLGLALWVEDRLGREVDLGAFDLLSEWDSMKLILDFVECHRMTSAGPGTTATRSS